MFSFNHNKKVLWGYTSPMQIKFIIKLLGASTLTGGQIHNAVLSTFVLLNIQFFLCFKEFSSFTLLVNQELDLKMSYAYFFRLSPPNYVILFFSSFVMA